MHTPNAKIVRTSGPATEPVTLAEAKLFLRVEVADDDALISALITAARERCETIANRSFIATGYRLTLDYFPPYSSRALALLPPAITGAYTDRNHWLNLSDVAIELPYPPLLSVDSIRYVDQGGVMQTVDLTFGVAVTISAGTPGQITPAYGKIFPIPRPQLGAVTIDFTAGYGADATALPKSVGQAVKLLVSHYYEHRTSDVPEPAAVKALLGSVQWGFYG